MVGLTEIIAALPKLNRSERIAVRAALEQLDVAVFERAGPDEALIFDALKRIAAPTIGYPQFLRSSTGKAWVAAWPQFAAFKHEVFSKSHTKSSSMLVYACLFNLLSDYLQARQRPVTLKTLVDLMPSVQMIFDEQFPGYRAGGMTDMIYYAMTEGKR